MSAEPEYDPKDLECFAGISRIGSEVLVLHTEVADIGVQLEMHLSRAEAQKLAHALASALEQGE